MSKFPSIKTLTKKGFPYAIITGLIAAHLLGWDGKTLNTVKNWHELRVLFPASGIVEEVDDGDTFVLTNGIIVRLVGINTPEKGQPNYQTAMHKLYDLVIDKKVYLEYDRYQDDKFTRVLAWVWTGCESNPKFLPADYMHKSDNESNPGLLENPEGCKNGKLINEEMIKTHLAVPTFYKDRGELKYQKRLLSP
jgi:endonuclease YncB( thermonuclease family)